MAGKTPVLPDESGTEGDLTHPRPWVLRGDEVTYCDLRKQWALKGIAYVQIGSNTFPQSILSLLLSFSAISITRNFPTLRKLSLPLRVWWIINLEVLYHRVEPFPILYITIPSALPWMFMSKRVFFGMHLGYFSVSKLSDKRWILTGLQNSS